ncbi:prolyl hydroxylase EGLN3 [Salminus brasiliensis]|uniref:prolyl hydroxylase EGLN3 n=1 Tax=Salminus brasiliensis TaxID=930266 RepID=UPI003B831E5B
MEESGSTSSAEEGAVGDGARGAKLLCSGSAEGEVPRELLQPHSNRSASSERRRLSTHKLVQQYVAPCMNSYGLCIVDNFLGNRVGERVLHEVRRIHESGSMQDGQLACQTRDKSKAIRGDKIAWLDGTEAGCHNIGFLLSRMDKLITVADGQLGSYKIRGRHKSNSPNEAANICI